MSGCFSENFACDLLGIPRVRLFVVGRIRSIARIGNRIRPGEPHQYMTDCFGYAGTRRKEAWVGADFFEECGGVAKQHRIALLFQVESRRTTLMTDFSPPLSVSKPIAALIPSLREESTGGRIGDHQRRTHLVPKRKAPMSGQTKVPTHRDPDEYRKTA